MPESTDQSPEYMNVAQVAEFLSVSPATIHRWRRGIGVSEPLPSIKVSASKILFDVAAVRGWMDELGGDRWEEE